MDLQPDSPIGSVTRRQLPGFRGSIMDTPILSGNRVTDFEGGGGGGSEKFQVALQVTSKRGSTGALTGVTLEGVKGSLTATYERRVRDSRQVNNSQTMKY